MRALLNLINFPIIFFSRNHAKSIYHEHYLYQFSKYIISYFVLIAQTYFLFSKASVFKYWAKMCIDSSHPLFLFTAFKI